MYPYQVSTIEQLQKIRNYSDKFYKQTNDIDASQTKNWNDGRGFLPIGDDLIQFSGNYDGSNFKITHLTINNFDEASGLFGRTKRDRKSTRLNSSHVAISYAVFCLKK